MITPREVVERVLRAREIAPEMFCHETDGSCMMYGIEFSIFSVDGCIKVSAWVAGKTLSAPIFLRHKAPPEWCPHVGDKLKELVDVASRAVVEYAEEWAKTAEERERQRLRDMEMRTLAFSEQLEAYASSILEAISFPPEYL